MAHARSPSLFQARVAAVLAAGIALAQLAGFACAQNNNTNNNASSFPTKPVRVVVPFSPGGTSDILARMIMPKLSEIWGQPVVIETRTGAGGTIGAGIVAKASSGIKSVKDLIALAQGKPGQVFFSHAGAGSATHMNGERFRLAAGIKVVNVGFKGASDATIEVVAGRVQFAIVGLAGALGFIQDGKLLAVAVGTPQRSPLLPDVPTIAETLPTYSRDGSHSLLAPAGVPRPILAKISQDVKRVFEQPDIKERLKNFDYMLALSTPEEHDRIIRADIETFSGVVRLAGLRPK